LKVKRCSSWGWCWLRARASNFKVKIAIPLSRVSRVLKGKDILFCSRDELSFSIHLLNLGVGNDMELDRLLFLNTLIPKIHFERDFLLSFPITGKVLEFLGIGHTSAILRHKGERIAINTRVLPDPHLGTDQSPCIIGRKSHLQLSAIHHSHTHFTSLHRLLISASHNGVAGRSDGGIQVDLGSGRA
jgi:hypothetical protein